MNTVKDVVAGYCRTYILVRSMNTVKDAAEFQQPTCHFGICNPFVWCRLSISLKQESGYLISGILLFFRLPPLGHI